MTKEEYLKAYKHKEILSADFLPEKDRPFFNNLMSITKKLKANIYSNDNHSSHIEFVPPARAIELLDFDASDFPDNYTLEIYDMAFKVQGMKLFLVLSRKKNKLTIEFNPGFIGEMEDPHLNPLKVFSIAKKEAKKYGFTTLVPFYYIEAESLYRSFFYEINAKGSVTAHYKKGLAKVEKLIGSAVAKVQKGAAAGLI